MQHHFSSVRFFFLALLLVLAANGVRATGIEDDLYRARVVVADDSEAARTGGFRAALAQVVVKLSGQRQVLDRPEVTSLLDAAANLVEEYRYHRLPAAAAAADAAAAPEGAIPLPPVPPELTLEVRFAAPTLDEELRRIGVPRWPAERRPVLLWLGGTDQERSALAPLARAALEVRGVPVLEPLWDLQDTQALAAPALDPARVAEASRRYEAAHWLLLEPQIAADAVRGSWRLGGIATATGNEVAEELRAWVEAAVNAAVDALASGQAYLPSGQTSVAELGIDGIATYDAYRAAIDALDALEMVRGIEVKALSAGRLTLRLQVDGAPELLQRALAGNPHFAEVTDVAAGPGRLYLWREP
jgi:hypothetical protein